MGTSLKNALRCGHELNGNGAKYRIDEVLGQGTFGIVYRCHVLSEEDTGDVAVKEFFLKDINGRTDGGLLTETNLPLFKQYRERFKVETEHLSNITHEGVVKVLNVFAANGTDYMVMEYLPGGSLNRRIKAEEKLTETDTLHLAGYCCRALEYLHENHMLHLDIKPLNIVMDEHNLPKLVDFGLSKVFDEDGNPETQSPIGLGTPCYAPLEQVVYDSTKKFSPTLDVYAMGATLFHMLTGMVPPTAINVLNSEGIIGRILNKSGVSPCCTALVEKAMSPVIARRTKSVLELSEDIQAAQCILESGYGHQHVQAEVENALELYGFTCSIPPGLTGGVLYALEELLSYMKEHVIPGTSLHYHPYGLYYLRLLCSSQDCSIMLHVGDTATLNEWLHDIRAVNRKLGMELRLATTEEMGRLFAANGAEHISYGHCIAYDADQDTYRIYDCKNRCVPELEITMGNSYQAVLVCERNGASE